MTDASIPPEDHHRREEASDRRRCDVQERPGHRNHAARGDRFVHRHLERVGLGDLQRRAQLAQHALHRGALVG